MSDDELNAILGHLSGDGALDTATSRAILERVGANDLPETLQVGLPHRVVAFGRHDALSSAFDEAVTAAISRGFDTTVRIAGGRAVVFHPGTVRFAWTLRTAEPAKTMHRRFQTLAEAVVRSLRAVGVESEIGELPGEYCAGQYSVHLAGGGKVMGVGQRLSRNAAQVGGMIVVNDSRSINEVLVPVYDLLEIPIEPRATGSVPDVAEVDPETIATRFTEAIASGRRLVRANLDEATTSRALELRADHIPALLA
ncbi:MAG: biotin/lipoate A/B protein ligase family protein [Acidimicrobiia bacterium]